jgi:hypothetical protein
MPHAAAPLISDAAARTSEASSIASSARIRRLPSLNAAGDECVESRQSVTRSGRVTTFDQGKALKRRRVACGSLDSKQWRNREREVLVRVFDRNAAGVLRDCLGEGRRVRFFDDNVEPFNARDQCLTDDSPDLAARACGSTCPCDHLSMSSSCFWSDRESPSPVSSSPPGWARPFDSGIVQGDVGKRGVVESGHDVVTDLDRAAVTPEGEQGFDPPGVLGE